MTRAFDTSFFFKSGFNKWRRQRNVCKKTTACMRNRMPPFACMGSGSESRLREKARQQRTVADSVNALYRCYRKLTNGADGATGTGLNGSLRAKGLVSILLRMGVKDKTVVDLGAGDGRVLLAAWLAGAERASGYELPANRTHAYVFRAVCQRQRVPTEVHPHAARRRWLLRHNPTNRRTVPHDHADLP
jgi:hypothetical protein